MKEGFFEGKDFGKGKFKALMPEYYPPKYKRYIREETELLKKKVKGARSILEAGIGTGRLIPKLAPLVKEFIGIDNADLMLKKSRDVAKRFPNVKILKGDLEKLSERFPNNYFDFSLCVWNTLGNVGNKETKILKELSKITSKSIFVTVFHRGHFTERKSLYVTIGVKIKKINREKEYFYSESGLKSKSYSLKDIEKIANISNLKIKHSKIIAGVILWVELQQKIWTE